MDAIIWNVRSVNTMQAFERLITMHRKHHFEFIGIREPMQQSHKMERYRARIGLAQAVVNVSNKIWAFIDEIFEVTILYNMTQQLTLRLTHTETHVELILTLVYAKCDRIERIELWDSLYAMASDMTVPWLVGGNFNVIYDEEEKFGGLPVSLIELKNLKKALSTWSRATYGDIFQKIASLEEVVLVHERQFEVNPTQMNRQRLQQVQAEMIKYLALEEAFWRQKASMLWFKVGDRNTKFFHAQVNGRRKRLKLSRIQNSLGNWIEEDYLIAE
ncbi:uncharacterized protein [Nicotiana sylvestris]|uniref:uncharacterized protein n=1 Tax=Nicotiana sylvestris TaxID=4096 RepID=UPI00388CC683